MDRTGGRDKDLIAVARTTEAKSGDVVVARFGDDVTVKRFVQIDERHVERRPESTNPAHKVLKLDLAKHVQAAQPTARPWVGRTCAPRVGTATHAGPVGRPAHGPVPPTPQSTPEPFRPTSPVPAQAAAAARSPTGQTDATATLAPPTRRTPQSDPHHPASAADRSTPLATLVPVPDPDSSPARSTPTPGCPTGGQHRQRGPRPAGSTAATADTAPTTHRDRRQSARPHRSAPSTAADRCRSPHGLAGANDHGVRRQ